MMTPFDRVMILGNLYSSRICEILLHILCSKEFLYLNFNDDDAIWSCYDTRLDATKVNSSEKKQKVW